MRLLKPLINLFKPKTQSQSGQTLIETMIGIFILITALSSGLGLAIYALSSSTNSSNQMIASNLAREGVEVARMMRDTNWMAAPYASSANHLQNCTYAGSIVKLCFPRTFVGPSYNLRSYGTNEAGRYRFVMRVSPSYSWSLDSINGQENYMLCLQPDGTYQHNTNGAGVTCTDGMFARQVQILNGRTTFPYTGTSNSPTALSNHSPERVIRSVVVWQGKGCTPFNTSVVPALFTNTACRVVVDERLTNWRDYR